jgi:RHS repeat-associated protein
LVYDPDNFPDLPCGDEVTSIPASGVEIARGRPEVPPSSIGETGAAGTEFLPDGGWLAPYRVIGITLPTPTAAPRLLFYHLDHLGTPRVITNAAGAVVSKHHYLPFGEEMPLVAQDSTNRRQFTGHERDPESGADYMMARYYSSSVARFLTVDPGNSEFLADPQSWNRYTYARNNPLTLIDPDGREPIVPKTAVTYFPVTGGTVGQAWESANAYVAEHAPTLPPGKVAWTDWDVSYTTNIAYGSDGEVVSAINVGVTVTVTTAVNLPRWIAPPDAEPGAQEEFDSYVRNVCRPHEQGHVDIAIQGGREVEAALKNVTAKGKTRAQAGKNLRANNAKSFAEQFSKIKARQQAFDAEKQAWESRPSYGGSRPQVLIDGVDVGGV